MTNFLRREIKMDGKGLFVYYGPSRFRPNPRTTTQFKIQEIVSIDLTYRYSDSAKVFNNIKTYEIWHNYKKGG